MALDLALAIGVALLPGNPRRTTVADWRAPSGASPSITPSVQAIFDSAFDAIITYDRSGRVHTVNRAAEQLFGCPADEMEGVPLHRFLRWTSGHSEDAVPDLPSTGVVWMANALRGDGESIPTEMSLGQSGEGEALLYNAIIRDIRDRVEAERRIRAFAAGLETSNRRLEEVNAQLEEARASRASSRPTPRTSCAPAQRHHGILAARARRHVRDLTKSGRRSSSRRCSARDICSD